MRPFSAGAFALSALFAAAPAGAFCRTKACDTKPSYGDVWDSVPDPAECVRTSNGCLLQGTPLRWPKNCLSFGVQRDGSESSGIDFETARAVIAEAFDRWNSVDCGGGPPSFVTHDAGAIECRSPEYNQDQENANVLMFRDADWPYASRSGDGILALTTITYNVENAQIYDADIEFNSHQNRFTVTDDPLEIIADLSSVATHEIGHFLGLSHSSVDSATMRGIGYEPGSTGLRTLDADDVAGICEIFPPGQSIGQDCEPRHGFAPTCAVPLEEGCALRRPGRGARGGELALLAAALMVAAGRRRIRRRP